MRAALLGAIKAYRLSVGQVFGGSCRFYPSCSAYAEQAVAELGVVRGVVLSTWRLLRCSPLSAGGIDYPPGARSLDLASYDVAIQDARRAGGMRREASASP